MSLAALDLNADRLWALNGDGPTPQVVPLDGSSPRLPLVFTPARKGFELGRAGLALCRKSPYLVCRNFLTQLGTNWEWRHDRHRLDAAVAMTLVFERVRAALGEVRGISMAVPAYLSVEQVRLLASLAQDAGLSVTGVLTRTLAAGLNSYARQPWHHVGIFLDIDEQALTCTLLRPSDLELHTLGQRVLPTLGMRLWKERLLARIADECVRVSRRDPRESADADQMLYDQLGSILEAGASGKPAGVQVQGSQWFQKLELQPADLAAACAPMSRQAAEEVARGIAWADGQKAAAAVYLLAGVARLPGLAAAIQRRCGTKLALNVLPHDAAIRAALELATRIDQLEQPAGFFSPAAPLPAVEHRVETPQVIRFPTKRASSDYK